MSEQNKNVKEMMEKLSLSDIESILKCCAYAYCHNDKYHDEISFLTWAIYEGKYKLAEVLLEFIDDINPLDGNESSYSAVHAAVYKNNFRILRKLLDKGFDLKCQTDFYTNVLHLAAESTADQNVEMMDFLLNRFKSMGDEKFASGNLCDDDGNSTLLRGLQNNPNISSKMVRRILDAGCDPRERNRYGHYPIDVAKNRTDAEGLEIQKMIEEAIEKFNERDNSKDNINSMN